MRVTSQSGPPEGSAWRPSPSGNHVSWDGGAVVKRYGARLDAYARERALLKRLGALPVPLSVPRPLAGHRFGELRYAYIDGVSGAAAVEAGQAPQLLGAMGTFLRQLHAIDPQSFADILPGYGPVLVHGDFAHYNVIADATTGALVGVIDWEEAHLGSAVLDLAWCEWQFATRFPRARWALKYLFEAYGETPAPEQREEVLRHRFEELRARATQLTETGAERNADPQRLHRCSFDNRTEAAAFVAALSRFLDGPAGVAYRESAADLLVWATDEHVTGRPDLYLSDAALRATADRFGAPPHLDTVEASRVPANCELLYGAG